MRRMVALQWIVAVGLGGCDYSAGEAGPPPEDAYYALYLAEVLELGERWWGYPPPSHYCVAIAPGSEEPDLDQSRDPTQMVLDSLGKLHPTKVFHPYSQCGPDYPFTVPAGDTAGLVWAKPLETSERNELSGGWLGPQDLTEWGCMFAETEGLVELQSCKLRTES